MDADHKPGEMTPYDRTALAEIQNWRGDRLAARTRRRLPHGVRDRMRDVGQKARTRAQTVPGLPDFEKIFLKSLEGLMGLGARAATATVPKTSIAKAYRKRGLGVVDIEDVRTLELSVIDKVKPRLGLRYTAFAAVEGAGAGFAVSGGELLATEGTVFGAGAGAAPGAAVVIGAMAADAAAVLLAGQRAVAHIAAYYGYDAERPEEQLFMLGVIGLGTASEAGKVAAYVEINKVVQALARRATWEQLNQSVVTRVVQKVFTRLGFRLTQSKLGQAVPIMGIAIGAGMNAQLLMRITDDAEHLYRERFLQERYGLEPESVALVAGEDLEGSLNILEIVDAEIVDERDGETTDDPPCHDGG